MSEHIEVSTVICHIWSDIVFCVNHNADNTYKKTNNNRLPRIAVPFERHPYSRLSFARNCSSGEGLRKRVTLFPNLSAIYVVQFA